MDDIFLGVLNMNWRGNKKKQIVCRFTKEKYQTIHLYYKYENSSEINHSTNHLRLPIKNSVNCGQSVQNSTIRLLVCCLVKILSIRTRSRSPTDYLFRVLPECNSINIVFIFGEILLRQTDPLKCRSEWQDQSHKILAACALLYK